MRLKKISGVHYFHLDEPGDDFDAARNWILENCKPSMHPWQDDIANCYGAWTWKDHRDSWNSKLEATNSGRVRTTDIDEALQNRCTKKFHLFHLVYVLREHKAQWDI